MKIHISTKRCVGWSRLDIHVAKLLNKLSHIRIFIFIIGFMDGLDFGDQVLDFIDDILGLF
jgi:hypothetical protein